MLKQILKRILISIPLLLIISFLVYLMIHMLPGDPITIMFGKTPSEEQIAILQEIYHLDEPVVVQYFLWLKNFLRGDWGVSFMYGRPARDMIMERLGRTAILCVNATVICVLIAFPLGIRTATKANTMTDLSLTSLCMLMISIPVFYIGTLLLFFFSVRLQWFPATGYVPISQGGFWAWFKSICLPSLTLGISLSAATMRFLRSSVLETMNMDYVMLARAKGNRESRVLYIHTLRNAMIPVITHLAMQVTYMLGGSIIVEQVFSYPGLGQLLNAAMNYRDYPLVQAGILVFAFFAMVFSILVDVIYTLLDPRVSFGKKESVA